MTPKQLRAARRKLGMTQAELGKALHYKGGRGQVAVSMMERGKQHISWPVGVAVGYLMNGYLIKKHGA